VPSKLPAIAEAGPESESTATPVISVQDIVHRYNGRSALDHVSFDVRPAELFGLLGPNGSGKTTLFRILSTLMVPTAGRALIKASTKS
jgi:ABC-2 type transport system ATP-binding protein